MYNLLEQDAAVAGASTSAEWLGESLEEWAGFAGRRQSTGNVESAKIHADIALRLLATKCHKRTNVVADL
jgi:hypothetical protein